MVTINPALLTVVLESWLSGETAHALIARTLQSDPTTDPDKTLQQFIEDATAQVDALKDFKPRADTEGDRPQEPNPNKAPGPLFAQTPDGDWVCEHGTASDVHCCGCHSGFLFDSRKCVCF